MMPESDVPLYWRHETSGRLATAVQHYLEWATRKPVPGERPPDEPSKEEMRLLWEYVDRWSRHFHLPKDVLELVRLDRQNNAGPIDFRHTVARLSDWGCDPL